VLCQHLQRSIIITEAKTFVNQKEVQEIEKWGWQITKNRAL